MSTDYGPSGSNAAPSTDALRTGPDVHWFCSECNTFDGPIAGKFCDVCADGTKVKRVVLADTVLAAVFDALSWMDPETASKWRAEPSYKRLAEALREAE